MPDITNEISVLQGLIDRLSASSVEIFNVTATTHDVEYSQEIPDGCKILLFRIKSGSNLNTYRISYEATVEAVPGPSVTFKADEIYYRPNIYLTGSTIYFSCSADSQNVEIEAWY